MDATPAENRRILADARKRLAELDDHHTPAGVWSQPNPDGTPTLAEWKANR
jgi:hypothetical protein